MRTIDSSSLPLPNPSASASPSADGVVATSSGGGPAEKIQAEISTNL